MAASQGFCPLWQEPPWKPCCGLAGLWEAEAAHGLAGAELRGKPLPGRVRHGVCPAGPQLGKRRERTTHRQHTRDTKQGAAHSDLISLQ